MSEVLLVKDKKYMINYVPSLKQLCYVSLTNTNNQVYYDMDVNPGDMLPILLLRNKTVSDSIYSLRSHYYDMANKKNLNVEKETLTKNKYTNAYSRLCIGGISMENEKSRKRSGRYIYSYSV